MSKPLRLVILGLSLSSSWGNGHATTYRVLVKALAERGHDILFLERDVPWYAANRDLPDPSFCRLRFYESLAGLDRYASEIAGADAVIVGSYVPDGIAVGRMVQATARGVVAFYDIDTPITLAGLGTKAVNYLSAEQIPGYHLYLSFTGGPMLAELMQRYGSPRAVALPCSATPLPEPAGLPVHRWDLSYLGTYSPDRQPQLDALLLEPARRRPDLRFAVAGPQYPDGIAWPANVERIEHVPPAGHAGFYRASRYSLNVTRAAMVAAGYSPSVRLFEAAAAGAAVISDRWAGIGDYFLPGRELLLADGTDTVLDLLDGPASLAAEVGRAARQRVVAAHTPAHRAEALERYLREAAATMGEPAGLAAAPLSAGAEVALHP